MWEIELVPVLIRLHNRDSELFKSLEQMGYISGEVVEAFQEVINGKMNPVYYFDGHMAVEGITAIKFDKEISFPLKANNNKANNNTEVLTKFYTFVVN